MKVLDSDTLKNTLEAFFVEPVYKALREDQS